MSAAAPSPILDARFSQPPESYGQRVWRTFRGNRRAYFGLVIVVALFVVAILSPFLANNKPLFVIEEDGAWGMPIFATMANIDWRYLLYGIGSALIFGFRKRWSFRVGLGLVVAMVLVVESFCFFRTTVLDATDYKTFEVPFKLMPPIPYSPEEQSSEQFLPPSWTHLCGTDSLGRDVASRMIHGARTSLSVGFVASGIAISIGTILGALAGYYRRWVDIIVSRAVEVMDCFPVFFLIITIIAFLPRPSLFAIMAVIGITSWAQAARLVRGEFLKLSVQPFTLAALASGANDLRVIFGHILPNSIGPILVTATFGVSGAILVETSLAFLGFGVPPPTPTWGDTLSEARAYIDFAWWLATFPGIAIFITITSYNLVGEGLRDAIDPRLRT